MQTATYSQRVTQLLGDWALLAGQHIRIARDPRMAMLSRILPRFDGKPPARSRLCADGSPVEFCERIGVLPQSPAITVEPPAWEGISKLGALCRTVREIAPPQDVDVLRRKLKRYEDRVKTYWIGADFGQPNGVRIYCHLKPDTRSAPPALPGVRLSSALRRVVSGLAQSGTLRLAASSFQAADKGAKLAFQHPLAAANLEALAGECGVPYAALRDYMRLLDPHRGGWRKSRCGLAVAVDADGDAAGLTVYHYAAPYFRDDQQLREFALRLAERFVWNTKTYRASSRLLDRPGERVRSLIGFTVATNGGCAMRLYGRTGAGA